MFDYYRSMKYKTRIQNPFRIIRKEYKIMKGYYVTNGYMGYVDGVYRLFASEADYYEYLED